MSGKHFLSEPLQAAKVMVTDVLPAPAQLHSNLVESIALAEIELQNSALVVGDRLKNSWYVIGLKFDFFSLSNSFIFILSLLETDEGTGLQIAARGTMLRTEVSASCDGAITGGLHKPEARLWHREIDT